jgi:DNA-binding transcriptional MerR regulator
MENMLRPVDLARAVGLSAQMMRNYEDLGFLPPAGRTATGHRRYGPQHLHALQTARILRAGYGWQHARRIMQMLHQGDVAGALAVVDGRHAELACRRREIDDVFAALHEVAQAGAELGALPHVHGQPSGLSIGEAARRVGVRPSALRFWEAQGLLHPERDRESRYRRYHREQFRRLQIIALLRKGGYSFAAIRSALDELSSGPPQQALAAIEARRQEVNEASGRCAAATAAFWDYLQERIQGQQHS